MKATILDTRPENGSICYLCKISLEEYIKNLPDSYKNYPIQREIVKNVYLDNLVETVLRMKHIPPIVLVFEDIEYKATNKLLDIQDFKILDGLQRTHRLKIIYDTILFFEELKKAEKIKLSGMKKFSVSRIYSKQLKEFGSSSNILFSIKEFVNESKTKDVLSTYSQNYQWFEIWGGLTLEQEVHKMLVLNAGHKPVNIRHQLEILFLNLLPFFEEMPGFRIMREKEQSSTTYFTSRRKGEFHFSILIASLLSYDAGKPITTNTSLIQNLQNTPIDFEESKILSLSFLKEFVSFLIHLDNLLAKQYGKTGTQWIGREVVLVGLMGALGQTLENSEEDAAAPFNRFINIIEENPTILNLSEFEEVRLGLDWSQVNIGNLNKQAVYSAVQDLLLEAISEEINWQYYFGLEI
jgi:hypothetical protein